MRTRRPSFPHNQSVPKAARERHVNCYPFTAIVGQDEMKLALILNVIDPSIGGVLMMGHRGTGKSTAVRALADLLPEISVASDCPYSCNPSDTRHLCERCAERLSTGKTLKGMRRPVPVVDLPLSATEDRVCGAIDIERALKGGVKAFEPGLLARANRGFLYIDEVNLLEDHLVDLLLDVAVSGRNKVERENISVEHPARFVLIGSGNPEEGQLRPQLLDRFGLYVEVKTENDADRRAEIVLKRDAFDRDPQSLRNACENDQAQLRRKITRARKDFLNVKIEDPLLRRIAQLCSELTVDGHRGELTIMRAARALAAFGGRKVVGAEEVRCVTIMSLHHRLRRDALEEAAGSVRIEQALERLFPKQPAAESVAIDHDPDYSSPSPASHKKSRAGNQQSTPLGRNGSALEVGTLTPPTVDARLPELPLGSRSKVRPAKKLASHERNGRRSAAQNSQRGRYTRAVLFRSAGARLALDATLRLALQGGGDVSLADLRFKQFARRNGKLFIFAIDTSGSMALNRINQAKGALLRLLRQSYVNRDSVAIIGFGGTRAAVLLPPSRSILRARRVLDTLTIGGGTPLSAGLACAIGLARRAVVQENSEIVLLLFSDGHANVPLSTNGWADQCERQGLIADEVKRLGREMRKLGIEPLVIDTQNVFPPNGEAHALAESLGAQYLQVKKLAQN